MANKSSIIVLALLIAGQVASAQDIADGQKKYGVVEFSVNFMREQPAYEAEMGDQALMGTVAEIVGTDSYWKRIVTPEPYTAWVNDMGIVEMSQTQIAKYVAAPKYICVAEYSHIYSRPDRNSDRLSDLVMGDLLRVWYKADRQKPADQLSKKSGNVRSGNKAEMFLGVIMPSGKKGYVPEKDLESFSVWAASRRATVGNIIATAKSFLGIPYMWGGTSVKAVDCSGFTRSVWFMNGILLPRNASQQAGVGDDIDFHPDYSIPEDSPEYKGEMLKRISHLKPGDLIFFGKRAAGDNKERISHVAIYLGHGKYIHSSQYVRISSLIPGDKDYSRSFIRARRVLGREDTGKGIVSMLKSPAYFGQ